MSNFLGPIHYMMYEKIKFQDKLTEALLNDDELKFLNKHLPPVAKTNLDEIIDENNIHGYLASKIDLVEARLAYAISRNDSAKEIFYQIGEQLPKKSYNSNEEVFNDINMIILDGMPCDHALSATETEDGALYLITNVDTHQKYKDNPLSINPEDSLSNSCDGNHDHDSHESFLINNSHLAKSYSES